VKSEVDEFLTDLSSANIVSFRFADMPLPLLQDLVSRYGKGLAWDEWRVAKIKCTLRAILKR
jgi:hypothetical protein